MLSGFNTNIRHRGVLFHVQSEDSGRDYPHIITHLYHGGTILVSQKSSYAERLGEERLSEVVRELMERQHKALLKRLCARDFDDLIRERLGPDVFDDAADTKAQTRSSDPPPPSSPSAAPRAGDSGRSFGEGIVSNKPLDEVILNYLVDNARKRKRSSGSR